MKRAALGLLVGAAAVYALSAADLWLRARGAYLEGERQMAWAKDPAAKRAHFDAECEAREAELAAERRAGRLGQADLERRAALARVARDEAVAESSLKYAAAWFQTAVEVFVPPESRWTRLARERLAEARRLRRAELDSSGFPREGRELE